MLCGAGEPTLLSMATDKSSNTNKATANTRKAAARSAENRRCPKCNRKSALKFISDEYAFGHVCRWADCDYEHLHHRST